MDAKTIDQLHTLALTLQNGGRIAKAVTQHAICTGKAGAPCEMLIAQRIMADLIKRHNIPCEVSLGLSTDSPNQVLVSA